MLNKQFNKILLALLLVPLIASAKFEQIYSEPAFNDPDRLTRIRQALPSLDKLYTTYAQENNIPGYCYAVVVDGNLIHTKCDGYADVENKIRATQNTAFCIASLTKSFTAMSILKLRDAGKLTLDDPISMYLPEMNKQKLTKDSPPITIRDLLTHSAGLPQEDPWSDRKLSDTTEEFLNMLKEGLYFSNATGLEFEYSSLSYTILGYIVSKVSGMPYQEYIAKNIWQPLSMQSAAWDFADVPEQNLAHAYRWDNDHWVAEPMLHNGVHGSMGGMYVSIKDFSKYVALHQDAWPPRNSADKNIPVSRATIRSMHQSHVFAELNTNYKLLDGTNLGYTKMYGYGLYRIQDTQSKAYVLHPGSLPGYHAHWNMLPDYGVAVIVMGNIKNAPRFDYNMQALNTLVKEAKLQPRFLPPSNLLQQRQQALLKLLPNWKDADKSKIFAANFFLDNDVEQLRQQYQSLFNELGKSVRVSELVPENQLRGAFIIEGEKSKQKVEFCLMPEYPALIHELTITPVDDN